MRVSLWERLRYWFDGTMSRGTPALIGWLALASVLLVATITGLAMLLAPDDVNGHPLHVAWMSLLRTLDPGTMGGDDGSYIFLTLMLLVTIGGIFIVSALVGVLATGLNGKLAELRKGRSRVVEQGHTIILGWSEEIFTIISELAQASEDNRACAVLLADRDKVEMEDEIRSRLRRSAKIRVVCRTGDPTDPIDLELVRPDLAGAIIIPAPAGDEPDIGVIKALLALNHRAWPPIPPPIVAVISDSTNMPAARLAGGPDAQLIDAEDITARLVVQSRRQAGLSVVCSELLSYEGDELYLCDPGGLPGTTYADGQLAYETAVLIGLRRADGTVLINPPPATKVAASDQTIVLAPTRGATQLTQTRPPVNAAVIKDAVPRPIAPDRTLVLAWNHRGPTIIRLLDRYVPAGSVLHVAAGGFDPGSLPPAADLTRLAATGENCDPTQRPSLEQLQPSDYHHVVVLSDDGLSHSAADARTLVTLLHLRDMKDSGRAHFAIVSELNDDSNRRLAQVTRADDFVVGRRMISLLLTQLSRSPHLNDILAELFEARGADIYLKPADDYVQPGVEATFATVIVSATRRGETAIGIRLHAEAANPSSYGVHLNPDKRAPLTLTAADKVIVLAHQ